MEYLLFLFFIKGVFLSENYTYTPYLHYPSRPFSDDQMRSGAATLYFIGLFYMFIGIMQIHRLYLQPCLRVFKKMKTFSQGTMESLVIPISVTAPEYFIAAYGCFLGVTDIGISAFLGTNAFTACVEKGILILFAGTLVEIDWYIAIRDMTTYSVTLLCTAMLITDGSIQDWNCVVLLLVFFIYWIFMSFNVYIEKNAREWNRLRIKFAVGPRLPDDEIQALHYILRRDGASTPELILEAKYEIKNDLIFVTGQSDEISIDFIYFY